MKNFEHTVFKYPVIGKITEENNQLMVSFVSTQSNKAWKHVFSYDKELEILESKATIDNMMDYFHSKHLKGSSIVLFICHVFIKIIGFFESVTRSILGSFFGFGLMGIFIVGIFSFIALMISVYAFILVAPFFALAYYVKWRANKTLKIEFTKLQEATLNAIYR